MSVISLNGSLINISGKVVNESGNPLPGASIYDPANTIAGTSSGLDGRFSLNAGSMSSIKISYMGYDSKIFRAGSVPKTVQLSPGVNHLNEVVLTAKKEKKVISIFKTTGFKLGLAALFLGTVLLNGKKNSKGLNGFAKVKI